MIRRQDCDTLENRVRDAQLYGSLRLPGGARVSCTTFSFEYESDTEVELSISIGSLSLAWPEVGGFPLSAYPDTSLWEPRLETRLLELARHVHARTPFLRGIIAVEGLGEDQVRRPGAIPAERHFGIIDVIGADFDSGRLRIGAKLAKSGKAKKGL